MPLPVLGYIVGGYLAFKAFEAATRQAPQEWWWDADQRVVWHVAGGLLQAPNTAWRPASEYERATLPIQEISASQLAAAGEVPGEVPGG